MNGFGRSTCIFFEKGSARSFRYVHKSVLGLVAIFAAGCFDQLLVLVFDQKLTPVLVKHPLKLFFAFSVRLFQKLRKRCIVLTVYNCKTLGPSTLVLVSLPRIERLELVERKIEIDAIGEIGCFAVIIIDNPLGIVTLRKETERGNEKRTTKYRSENEQTYRTDRG